MRLDAAGDITITGHLLARGGNGSGFRRTGGGGSGGAVLLWAGGAITLGPDAAIDVTGGKGAHCAWFGASGGGGGGGRIAIDAQRLIVAGLPQKPGWLSTGKQLQSGGGAGGQYGAYAYRNNGGAGNTGTIAFRHRTDVER